MRARVTLRGLVVEREPGRVEVVPWIALETVGKSQFDVVGQDGRCATGLKGVLVTDEGRATRAAYRLLNRAYMRAFRDGSLNQARLLEPKARELRRMLWFVALCVVAFPVIAYFKVGGPWWQWAGVGLVPSLALLVLWAPLAFQVPYFGPRGIAWASVTSDGMTLAHRCGDTTSIVWSEVTTLDLSGVPRVQMNNGTSFRVPAACGVGRMLRIVQKDLFVLDHESDCRAEKRGLVRAVLMFPLAGVLSGVGAYLGVQHGFLAATTTFPVRIGLIIGVGLPVMFAILVCIRLWTVGVPPWKKKAWTEMFR